MNRIKLLREQMGISQQALFADFFHTTVDYIVGYTDNPARSYETLEITYSPQELRHLDMYCRLTPRLRSGVDNLIESIISECQDS